MVAGDGDGARGGGTRFEAVKIPAHSLSDGRLAAEPAEPAETSKTAKNGKTFEEESYRSCDEVDAESLSGQREDGRGGSSSAGEEGGGEGVGRLAQDRGGRYSCAVRSSRREKIKETTRAKRARADSATYWLAMWPRLGAGVQRWGASLPTSLEF